MRVFCSGDGTATKMKLYITHTLLITWIAIAPAVFAQQNSAGASNQTNRPASPASSIDASVGDTRAVDPGAADSTVVYEAEFFDQFNPITASDMLDRIPGVDVFGGNRGGGGNRGLGTAGNLLINGQRIAGKDNSARDQLDRITSAEVERIEIIRDTSGCLLYTSPSPRD